MTPAGAAPSEVRSVTCDVLVVGTGAGGLSAAVTAGKAGLDVLVVEKESQLGGTTARSGGVLWLPCNPVSYRAGAIDDTIEAARTYLRHETGNFFDPDRVDAFLENGPRMVEFFERETSVAFDASPAFADYHPDVPGGRAGGRSIVARAFDGRALGDRLKDLRPPLREITFVGMMLNSSREVQHFFNVTRSLTSATHVARRLLAHAGEVVRSGRATRLTNGNALVARLIKSALDLKIQIWISSPAKELLRENGRVTGAVLSTATGPVTVHARRGVVLACGGFPHDIERRKQLFPHAPNGSEHATPAPAGNTGDGLRLATAVGAQIQDDLPNAAAWVPVSRVTYRSGDTGVFPHLIDRYKPGIIAVTRRGVRFTNESNSYHDVAQAMVSACRGEPEVAAWLLADHRAISRYGLGFAKPFPLPLTPHLRSGYLLLGRTIEELAAKAGIDGAALRSTIDTYNEGARAGEDRQFGRGSTAYNRFLGDPEHKPNPCVAPLERGPFYAVKMVPGDLGTFAGIRTDRHARVLDASSQPIAGLYAVGNDMASVMGGNYPGGGITLGPAMTFGFIAGRHLAGVEPDQGASTSGVVANDK
jgi:succinate dehydrogenase/fumarate reductase flavoprotein subunit